MKPAPGTGVYTPVHTGTQGALGRCAFSMEKGPSTPYGPHQQADDSSK